MEQAISRTGRRAGWSEFENNLLWETADEAQQQGLPLKAVFERIAQQTGRRPNSIRNYYYAQVQKREGAAERTQRFVPFTQQEVDWLMEQVLVARAQGQSVRSCLQKLADGDHSRMLRYQNKYRSVIKSRPEYVKQMVDRLNAEGVQCDTPKVNHSPSENTVFGRIFYAIHTKFTHSKPEIAKKEGFPRQISAIFWIFGIAILR